MDSDTSHQTDPGVTRREVLRRAAIGSTALGASGLIAACGSSAGGHGSSSVASSTSSAPPPKAGGTVRAGAVGGSDDELDPHSYFTRTAFIGVNQLFEGLLKRDHQFRMQLWLAEEVTYERADLMTIRVKEGIEFHNGKTLDADDVMFTLRRIIKLPGADAPSLSSIDLNGIRKLDARTVRVPLKRGDVSVEDTLAGNLAYVVPVGFDVKKPVGTGPFKFVSMTSNQQMTFTRNSNYWRHGFPYLDGMQVLTLSDDTARTNALLAGQVDAIEGLPSAEVAVVKANPRLKALISPSGQWLPFVMRTDIAPWKDVRVRQAMRLIANRPALITEGVAGYGRVGNDVFSPDDASYDRSLPQRAQDIEQAKSLLKAAGQSDLRATLVTSEIYTGLTNLAEVFAQQAQQAGVTLNLQKLDPTTFFGKSWLSYGLTQDFWTNRDYLSTAGIALAPGGGYNETHWADRQWDSTYTQALGTLDTTKRTELVHELQKIDWERGGYIIWGFVDFIDGLAARVQGLVPDPIFPLGGYGFGEAYLS